MEQVTPVLELGEGPHWDPSTESVYFVDLHQGKINRYHPKTKSYYYAVIGESCARLNIRSNAHNPFSYLAEGYKDVTFVIPVDGKPNTFVVGLGPSIGFVDWDGVSTTTSVPEHVKLIDDTPGNRLNDAKADATGRLWVGECIDKCQMIITGLFQLGIET